MVVLESFGNGAGDNGFAESDNIADNHPALLAEDFCRNRHRLRLKIHHLVLEYERQRVFAQPVNGIAGKFVGGFEIDEIRRNRAADPTLLDAVGEFKMHIHTTVVLPTLVKPVQKFLRRVLVKHIHIQFAVFCQPGQSQIAAADNRRQFRRIILAMHNIQFGVQGVPAVEFGAHFAVANLRLKSLQIALVFGGRDAALQLFRKFGDCALNHLGHDSLRKFLRRDGAAFLAHQLPRCF